MGNHPDHPLSLFPAVLPRPPRPQRGHLVGFKPFHKPRK
jgi:hypothetical protein